MTIAGLQHELTYRVRTEGPLAPTAGAPTGERVYWAVTEATLEGPRLRASLAYPGQDWMAVSDDGFWRPDVRLGLRADDGATVWMRYTGLVEQTAAFTAAAEADAPTGWADQHIRMTVSFETGSNAHGWLNRSLFVAAGCLLGTGRLEYEIYRVT